MKSIKEVSVESKILKRLQNRPECLKLVNYLIEDEELQEMQDYANNVSIKRLGYNDHGPVHMRQVTANSIKMLNILHECGIQTSLEKEEIGTFEDSMCAVVLAGFMHDLGMMIGRQGHEEMSVILAKPIVERALMEVFPHDLHRRVVIRSVVIEAIIGHMASRKILAVDDSVSIRKSISFILGQENFEVVEAENGADGLSKANADKFGLIITDINMPIMDGIQFIKELRNTAEHKFTPIIVLTTENQESKMQEGKAAGATGWIVKPFSSEKLIAVVKKIIG